MIFHMAAVDISPFDSRKVLKECCTEKFPWAGVVYLSIYIYINPIILSPLAPCGELNGADGCNL